MGTIRLCCTTYDDNVRPVCDIPPIGEPMRASSAMIAGHVLQLLEDYVSTHVVSLEIMGDYAQYTFASQGAVRPAEAVISVSPLEFVEHSAEAISNLVWDRLAKCE